MIWFIIVSLSLVAASGSTSCHSPQREKSFNALVYLLFKENFIPPGDILDVGCNFGEWSEFYSCLDPSRTVHCLEPGPVSFAGLHKNIKSPKVKTYNMGLSSEPGTISQSQPDPKGFVGQYKTDSSGGIEVTTIDLFFRKSGSVPGFLHIDVEGFELKVLQGAKEMITTHHPVFAFELHVVQDIAFTTELAVYAESFGYALYVVNELCGVSKDCRNVIAIPNDIVKAVEHSPGFELALRARTMYRVTGEDLVQKYHALGKKYRAEWWGMPTPYGDRSPI